MLSSLFRGFTSRRTVTISFSIYFLWGVPVKVFEFEPTLLLFRSSVPVEIPLKIMEKKKKKITFSRLFVSR